ncbi:MAG: ribosome biogenesis GTP-binding protein YihA/YsxC [Burkholderiales bacterium]|nr:ribosome biogenesis GTP-binding protein YihA/YsxC [Burkholderiales bacterium]
MPEVTRLSMRLLHTARFATTVAQPRQLPREGPPEVAFVGRSNSGKSTAINTLCERKRLAFASRTPGRTQALNFFTLGPGETTAAFLVDTPGYGYAKVPLGVKSGWDSLAGPYLRGRHCLKGVVMTLDIRREVTDADAAMLAWIDPSVGLLVLLTKSDKLGHEQRLKVRRSVLASLTATFPDRGIEVITFSAPNRLGLDETRARIERWLAAPETAPETAPEPDLEPGPDAGPESDPEDGSGADPGIGTGSGAPATP